MNPRPSQLGRVLRRSRFDGEWFTSVMVDLRLDHDYAYVLTGEAPGVEWDEPPPANAADDASSTDPLGPEADLPETIGEALFNHTGPERRELLILLPRVPDALTPAARNASS